MLHLGYSGEASSLFCFQDLYPLLTVLPLVSISLVFFLASLEVFRGFLFSLIRQRPGGPIPRKSEADVCPQPEDKQPACGSGMMTFR